MITNNSKIIKSYYTDAVLYEIVKFLQGRELVLFGEDFSLRYLKAHNVSYLKRHFDFAKFFNEPRNIYSSLAIFNNIPMFSYNTKIRAQQGREFTVACDLAYKKHKSHFTVMKNFSGRYDVSIIGYDIPFDFDEFCEFYDPKTKKCTKGLNTTSKKYCERPSPCRMWSSNFELVKSETGKLKALFDRYCVPYSLRFSGSGFHIVIPDRYLSIRVDKVQFAAVFAKSIQTIHNFTTLDTSIYDIRRIFKVPYSLDWKTGNVCLPLTDEQFNNFSYDIVKPENVIKNAYLRGDIIHNLILGPLSQSSRVQEFFIDFIQPNSLVSNEVTQLGNEIF